MGGFLGIGGSQDPPGTAQRRHEAEMDAEEKAPKRDSYPEGAKGELSYLQDMKAAWEKKRVCSEETFSLKQRYLEILDWRMKEAQEEQEEGTAPATSTD